jgi:O-antigen/teichoic acid export membrane protein
LVGRVARASALAQLFGQLVSFVQTVVLARLLTPTQVGIFAAGTVLTTLFTDFVEGGLRAGLVQRQGDLADADETVFRVTLMVGAAASLASLAAAPVIGIIFNSRAAGLVAAATSGVLLIHSLTNVPESVLQREFSVKRRLIVGPAIAVSYAVVSVGLAALGWGVWSMVAGTYACYITWVVSLWMITSWRPGRGHASFAMWRELARFGFPLVTAMIGFRLRTAVEALVVGRVLSTGALGFFRYGQRIARIPQTGIIEVGANTLFPAFSRIVGDRKRFAAAYLRALHWSMVGAAACTGLMIAAGGPAVVVLFGERWRGAGVALVAMSGLNIGSAISVVAQDAIKARGRTRLINWFTLADLFLGVGFLLILIGPFGFVGASLYISLTSLVTAAIMLGLAQLVVTVPLRRVLTVLATPIPSLLIATAATWWLEHDLLRSDTRGPILAVVLLAVDALVFCLVYLAVLTVFARSTVVTIVRKVSVLIARFRLPEGRHPGPRAELQRERQLRQLAAIVALLDVPKPAVVAVAPVEPMPGTDDIAESLARYRADHGARTVLVHADGAPVPPDAVEGDIESVAVRWSLASSESGGRMREVFPVDDTQDVRRLGMEHLGRLVTSLRGRADLVVIQSPAVSESAESYMVCAVADRTLLVAGAGSSADSVVAVRDQMERVGVSLLGVAFVERPRRHRAKSGSNDRPVSGPGAPDRPGPAPSATRATSHNSTADSRSMDMSARAVGALGTRSMGPTAPAARQATTADAGEEPTATVNGQVTGARLPESAAAPDASPEWPDETTPSADPTSWASRI